MSPECAHAISIQDIVSNNEIAIPPALWRNMRSSMPRAQIKQLISIAISAYGVKPPLRKLSLADARAGFNALRDIDTARLIRRGPWFARYQSNYALRPRTQTYIEVNYTGSSASNYFH